MLFICYPKCSTCQKAQKWLDARGVAYELRNIKEQKPTADEGNSALPARIWEKAIDRLQAVNGLLCDFVCA